VFDEQHFPDIFSAATSSAKFREPFPTTTALTLLPLSAAILLRGYQSFQNWRYPFALRCS